MAGGQPEWLIARDAVHPHAPPRAGGAPLALREAALVKQLSHPHIAALVGCITHGAYGGAEGAVPRWQMLYEWAPHTVHSLVQSALPAGLSPPSARDITYQALRALAHCHARAVVHRRLELSSLVYDPRVGTVKLSGFEGARQLSPSASSGRALTLLRGAWPTKPPEMLLPLPEMPTHRHPPATAAPSSSSAAASSAAASSAAPSSSSSAAPSSSRDPLPSCAPPCAPPPYSLPADLSPPYSLPVDLWAVGCILLELASGKPPFAPKPLARGSSHDPTELALLYSHFELLGTPDAATWPTPYGGATGGGGTSGSGVGGGGVSGSGVGGGGVGVVGGPEWPTWAARDLRVTYPMLDEHVTDLTRRLLAFDPAKRLTAAAALEHTYFEAVDKRAVGSRPLPEMARA